MKAYPCPLCQGQFLSDAGAWYHLTDDHMVRDTAARYVCWCGERYYYPSSMHAHWAKSELGVVGCLLGITSQEARHVT
jgi:hypothetical protein